MGIYIFSRPVHSGKTTELISWCGRQDQVSGILMPDIDGSRKLYDIETKDLFDIECIDPENNTAPLTTIGRFNFYTVVFEKANSILLQALAKNPNWLVIDEAGKLELDGKGFYEPLKAIADIYNTKPEAGNLLITVRDSLCNDMISFFKFQNFKVIRDLQELDQIKRSPLRNGDQN